MAKGKQKLSKYNLSHQQPYSDDFLRTMTQVFHWSRWVGVVGLETLVWRLWGAALLVLMMVIEGEAIWKVIKALAGWAVDMAGHRSVTARFAGTMFYASGVTGLVQCWRLSHCWEEVCGHWAQVEWLLSIQSMVPDTTLRRRMCKTVVIGAICATFEHIMDILTSIDFNCSPELCFRKYILKSHGFLILEFEYSDWMAPPVLFMSIVATVIWNLQDLIIILMSMGLTSRYQRLNRCVETVAADTGKEKPWGEDTEFLRVNTWRKIREAYVKQAMLVRRVDRCLGGIILLSTFFNFYFICLQLFLGITNGVSGVTLKRVYYVMSLCWLCVRTACTVLAAADVHNHSRLALSALHQCHTQFYNIEVCGQIPCSIMEQIERLQKQLSKDYVALTGMGFFSLNRTVVLQMAATVMTYVLVLIQYDSSGQGST